MGTPAPSILTGVHSQLVLLADRYFRTVAICYQLFVTFHLHSFPVILSHVSCLSFEKKKKKKKLGQRLLSAAHVYYARPLVAYTGVCFGFAIG